MKSRKLVSARSKHGQVLVQGTSLLMLMSVLLAGVIAILVTLGQMAVIQTKLRCAAQAGAQEALNVTTWAADGTPSYPSPVYGNILAVVNTTLTQMAMSPLPSQSFLWVNDPAATGTPGEYIFTVTLNYPFIPGFKDILSAAAFNIKGSASASSAFLAHKLVRIAGTLPPSGERYFPGSVTTKTDGTQTVVIKSGGVLVPAFGGGTDVIDGSPIGQFTKYGLVPIGTYVLGTPPVPARVTY